MTTDVTRLIDELRHLPVAEIQRRLDALEAERQTLIDLRRLAARAQGGTRGSSRPERTEAAR